MAFTVASSVDRMILLVAGTVTHRTPLFAWFRRDGHLLTRMALRFDSVFYYVRDLDRSVAFYTRVLGLTLRSRDAVARFDVDGVLFELVPAPNDAMLTGRGNARLCLAVDDMAQTVADLREQRVPVRPARPVENGLLATFRDPDGNELALWQENRA